MNFFSFYIKKFENFQLMKKLKERYSSNVKIAELQKLILEKQEQQRKPIIQQEQGQRKPPIRKKQEPKKSKHPASPFEIIVSCLCGLEHKTGPVSNLIVVQSLVLVEELDTIVQQYLNGAFRV